MDGKVLWIGVAFGLAAAASAAAQNERADREFLERAILDNNAEMKLGQLAESRATTPAVRRFGGALADGHFQVRAEANRLAAQLHITVPLRGAKDARDERAKLEGLAGLNFDRAFVRYVAMREAADLSAFRLASGGRDATADLARQSLPILERRLQAAQDLDVSLGDRPDPAP
jgi:putative membrane protein